MKLLILTGLLATLSIPALAWGLGVGNPAALVGQENYGFTMEVENQKKEIEQDPVESRRYLGKAIWGAADWLDLYVKLGVSDLKVYPDDGPTFRGSESMTYGGGGRVSLLETESPHTLLFFDVQGLSYRSDGEVMVPQLVDSDDYVDRYVNEYRWNELQFSLFTVWQREIWQPYVGFCLTNAWGRVERGVYRIGDEGEHFLTSDSNEFSEFPMTELILGSDFQLGGTGRLCGELRFGNDKVSFMVGLSELYR
jgi:hypothetical protein